eukprot:TRINITY_DN76341_c0_g1_i1.p1 TRINITY_DN76341_c0_g1~~TRINITY_DN76341_c0_g1_i1.p1  ORF type:complete len:180 (-),score=21.22 TRINITY_DN76341_c0_g1_i1:146-685(-)
MLPMACGSVLAAVPSRRPSFSESATGQLRPTGMPVTELPLGADGERHTHTGRGLTSDARTLAGAVGDERVDVSAQRSEDKRASEQSEMPERMRALSAREILSPSEIFDPQELAALRQLYDTAGSDVSDGKCSEPQECESRNARDEHSGLPQPPRTRRGFPAPSEYLTRQEILKLLKDLK